MKTSPSSHKRLLAKLMLVVDAPISSQEILNSILEENGFRKPAPIPVSTNHPPRLQVSYGRVLDLTEHTAIRSVLSDETVFFQKHRMSITEFLLLLALVEPAIGLARRSASEGLHEVSHVHCKLNPAEQLLLWLYWTKGTPMMALTELFGHLHETTLTRMIDHVSDCIEWTLGDLISWPTAEERKDLYGWVGVYDKAIAFLDGTHLPISKPTKNPSAYWSTYKQKYTQNYLVCVNPFALVIYIDGPFPGRGNDRGAFNQCTLATNPREFVSEGEVIVADGGFMGGPQLLVPFHVDTITHGKDEEDKQDMLSFNEDLSDGRVLVEDVFGWLKGAARVLEGRYRRGRASQAPVFRAMCCVYNFTRMMRMEYAQHLIQNSNPSP
jgi:hypothetical protein